MQRAVKVSLQFATTKKRHALNALLSRYRSAVNFFIKSLWEDQGKLDGATLARLSTTELSARYKSQTLKQALDIVISTRKAIKAIGKCAKCPVFQGAAVLDSKFISVEDGNGSFDLIVRISSLVRGARITIPTKRTAVLNKYLSLPGARLIQGCALDNDKLILWVDIPEQPLKTEGQVLGVDIGMNKMISDSNGNHYGTGFKPILEKIRRRIPKSKGRKRAYAERENYIGRTLNSLPWQKIRVLGVENLLNLKKGKRKSRGKTFRKAVAPWIYRRVLERVGHKAQENRVALAAVSPAYSSTTCPVCGECNKLNRCGENFTCVVCHHTDDADTVGARNILARTLTIIGNVEFPMLKRIMK